MWHIYIYINDVYIYIYGLNKSMGYVSPTWPWFLGVSENGLPQKKAMLQWDSKKRNDYQPSNLGGTLFWDQPVYVYIYIYIGGIIPNSWH